MIIDDILYFNFDYHCYAFIHLSYASVLCCMMLQLILISLLSNIWFN